jgi:hypothetical protein
MHNGMQKHHPCHNKICVPRIKMLGLKIDPIDTYNEMMLLCYKAKDELCSSCGGAAMLTLSCYVVNAHCLLTPKGKYETKYDAKMPSDRIGQSFFPSPPDDVMHTGS